METSDAPALKAETTAPWSGQHSSAAGVVTVNLQLKQPGLDAIVASSTQLLLAFASPPSAKLSPDGGIASLSLSLELTIVPGSQKECQKEQKSSESPDASDLPETLLTRGGVYALSEHFREPDSSIGFYPGFLTKQEADRLLKQLMAELRWSERDNIMNGELRREPRLSCWFGVPYTYSGVPLSVNPVWPLRLAQLRDRLERKLGARFNSVGCVLYRDGRDSIGWHADAEPSLGRNPLIASISLGCERRFGLKTRLNPPANLRRLNQCGSHLRLALGHGSLLVMQGSIQHHWLHAVLKDAGSNTPRINLAFRFVFANPFV